MHSLSLLGTLSLFHFTSVTTAHVSEDDVPFPKVFGGQDALRHLPRHMIQEIPHDHDIQLDRRDWSTPNVAKDKKCGEGVGFCDDGDCCSPNGWCGRGYDYCSSPNCQLDYSNGCDSSIRPLGAPTLDVPRPLIGNVTYDGNGITHCTNPGALALTFDDGPYNYTAHLLDVLAAHGAKATFFITGNNLGKGQIDIEENGWPNLIRRMHAEGHQIAAHTWGHENMTALNETEQVNQIHYLEMAFRNILGFFPTYMRPPYTECREGCQAVVKRMGYHIIYQNAINYDWQMDDPNRIQFSKDNFTWIMRKTNPREMDYVFLQHDTHYQTAWNLTDYMLNYFQLFNFSNSVTVGECLGDPQQNWYRSAGGAPNASLLLHKSHSNAGSSMTSNMLLYTVLLLICGQLMANMYL